MAGRRLRSAVAGTLARRYVAGDTLADALAVDRDLAARGFATTLGYWDAGDERPADVAGQYGAAIGALAGRAAGHVSIKLPALGPDHELLTGLAAAAADAGVALHCDSLAPDTADRVVELASTHGLGVTLPARWRRSAEDAQAVARRGLPVRVIKGQWADPDDPDRDPRDSFPELVDRLIAAGAPHVAVATHDAPLAAAALDRLTTAGVPCELQLLLGLRPGPALAAAHRARVPVRAYLPYGTAFLPYGLRALRREPARALRLPRDIALARREWRTVDVPAAATSG